MAAVNPGPGAQAAQEIERTGWQREVGGWDRLGGFFSGIGTGFVGGLVAGAFKLGRTLYAVPQFFQSFWDTFRYQFDPLQIGELNLLPTSEREKRREEMIQEQAQRSLPKKVLSAIFSPVVGIGNAIAFGLTTAYNFLGSLGTAIFGAPRGAYLGLKHGATGIGWRGAYDIMSHPDGFNDQFQNRIVGAAPAQVQQIPQAAQQQLKAAAAENRALQARIKELEARPPVAARAAAVPAAQQRGQPQAAVVAAAPRPPIQEPRNQATQEITQLRKQLAEQARKIEELERTNKRYLGLHAEFQQENQRPAAAAPQQQLAALPAQINPAQRPGIQQQQPNPQYVAAIPGAGGPAPDAKDVAQRQQLDLAGAQLYNAQQNGPLRVGAGPAPAPIVPQNANARDRDNAGNQVTYNERIILKDPIKKSKEDFDKILSHPQPRTWVTNNTQINSENVEQLLKAIKLTEPPANNAKLTLHVQRNNNQPLNQQIIHLQHLLREHRLADRFSSVEIGKEHYNIQVKNVGITTEITLVKGEPPVAPQPHAPQRPK